LRCYINAKYDILKILMFAFSLTWHFS